MRRRVLGAIEDRSLGGIVTAEPPRETRRWVSGTLGDCLLAEALVATTSVYK